MKKVKGIIIIAIITLSFIPILPPLEVHAQTSYQSYWSMDRPQKDIHFNSTDYNVEPPERVEGYGTDEYASVGLGVEIWVDSYWDYSPINGLAVLPRTHTIIAKASLQIGDYKYTFQHWENGETNNRRTLDVESNITIIAYYKKEYNPPSSGGCPYVYTWNGSGYMLDNNVLGLSEVRRLRRRRPL